MAKKEERVRQEEENDGSGEETFHRQKLKKRGLTILHHCWML